MNTIKENLKRINQRIISAAERAGRDPKEIKLVAVSKKVPYEGINVAFNCGQLLFGENYTMEAKAKIPQLDDHISWHFIGHLQTNKAKVASELFQVIETVDRLKLAKALNSHLENIDRSISVFIQVNIGKEIQKSGVAPEKAEELISEVSKLKRLRIMGLMTMPPHKNNPEDVRPYFYQMKKMLTEFEKKKLLGRYGPPELSMGMSGDFEIAIEEGATLVRVGTAIFGTRK